MQIEWTWRTDTGRVRSENEDSILVQADGSFAVLCDGMGGHQAGEVASRVAVASFTDALTRKSSRSEPESLEIPIVRRLVAAARAANEAVHLQAQGDAAFKGMGCTLVALVLRGGLAHFVSVGDSRLYLLRANTLRQITEDHTRIRMLQKMGIPLRSIDSVQLKGIITRAIGTGPTIDVDHGSGSTMTGDLWLLCSDGLTDELADSEIEGILMGAESADSAADTLVKRALAAGGRDNVTVALARVVSSPTRISGPARTVAVPRPSVWAADDPAPDAADSTGPA
jgi:PPM family protein phosphatase